jgi:hypothetical protein
VTTMDGQTLCPFPLQVNRRVIHSVTLLWYVFTLAVSVDSLPGRYAGDLPQHFFPHGMYTLTCIM